MSGGGNASAVAFVIGAGFCGRSVSGEVEDEVMVDGISVEA